MCIKSIARKKNVARKEEDESGQKRADSESPKIDALQSLKASLDDGPNALG